MPSGHGFFAWMQVFQPLGVRTRARVSVSEATPAVWSFTRPSQGMLGTLNLSKLEVLVLVQCHYDWLVEKTLARVRSDLSPKLTLYMSVSEECQEEGIHKVELRGVGGTESMLAARRMKFFLSRIWSSWPNR
ncbi:MAG: hypothetical protein J3R72DRAFT_487396 [Linnemannia gamsii]|nr:MAG: hypothetical protein J3R72DRAFT_487396 [Linnemannia gamsii]